MDELVNDYVNIMNKAEKVNYSNYKEKNIYRLRWVEILKEIDNFDNKIWIILEILKKWTSFEILRWLVGFLRKYEPILAKNILVYNSKIDPLSELLVMNWDKDQIENEKIRTNNTINKIEKYNKWKIENKEKYDETMKELNIIIEKL